VTDSGPSAMTSTAWLPARAFGETSSAASRTSESPSDPFYDAVSESTGQGRRSVPVAGCSCGIRSRLYVISE